MYGFKILCEISKAPLKFHTKFWAHTPQNMHFTIFYFCVWVTISLNCLSETGVRWSINYVIHFLHIFCTNIKPLCFRLSVLKESKGWGYDTASSWMWLLVNPHWSSCSGTEVILLIVCTYTQKYLRYGITMLHRFYSVTVECVITRSNIIWYCAHHCDHWGKM